MIDYLQIENFKSLKKIGISLQSLNLLFGMNGMGKSSIIQSLLLLRQSYWASTSKGLYGLYINGELIKLGTSADILCLNADEEIIRFYICFDKKTNIDVSYRQENSLPVSIMKVCSIKDADVPFAESEALFGNNFCYLSADHIEPRNNYSTVGWDKNGVNPLGRNGEYAVPFLALEGEEFKVPKELCCENAKTNRLFDQVSAWMSFISPGVKINAVLEPFANSASLNISYEVQRMKSTPFLPVNVGFGVPYVLPLIVALLTSQRNGLLLIENPESHLHPKGQVGLAKLIAKAASRGTQIVCESHSDHIINGIRVAVKDRVLPSEDLSVLYFDNDEKMLSRVQEIDVDDKGNLSDYPLGLLDEWGIQMSSLL